MLKKPNFWEDEKDANILIRNEGFLSSTTTTPSIDGWLKDVGVTTEMVKKEADDFKKHCETFNKNKVDEIFVRDSVRIFASQDNRDHLVKILSYLQNKFQGYHQGLALSCSYVLLYLDTPETLALFTVINTNSKYLPDIWQAQAMNMAIDGYVFQELMHQHYPSVASHLLSLGVLPETYCQKYWCALNIGVLPFDALHSFLTRFFKEGFHALFHYALSLCAHMKDQLLACKDPGAALEYLRFDLSCKKLDRLVVAKAVVADTKDYGLAKIDFKPLREKAYNTNLKDRTYYDDEKKEVDLPKCGVCKKEEAEYYCKKCDEDMCEDCMDDNPPAGHDDEHETYTQDEKFDDSDDDDATPQMASLSIKGTGLTPVTSPVGDNEAKGF